MKQNLFQILLSIKALTNNRPPGLNIRLVTPGDMLENTEYGRYAGKSHVLRTGFGSTEETSRAARTETVGLFDLLPPTQPG